MTPSFKILKSDLKKYPSLRRELDLLSESVYESEDAFVYSPKADSIYAFTEKLNKLSVARTSINLSFNNQMS